LTISIIASKTIAAIFELKELKATRWT